MYRMLVQDMFLHMLLIVLYVPASPESLFVIMMLFPASRKASGCFALVPCMLPNAPASPTRAGCQKGAYMRPNCAIQLRWVYSCGKNL